jgi:hypothetical protein
VKDAAVTVPFTSGSLTCPVIERAAKGVMITVPPVAPTAMFPKDKSAVLRTVIGKIILAEELAVVEACPKETAVNPRIAIAKTNNFFMFLCF